MRQTVALKTESAFRQIIIMYYYLERTLLIMVLEYPHEVHPNRPV